jgi:SPP1 family predicted phage head-tail adaptor
MRHRAVLERRRVGVDATGGRIDPDAWEVVGVVSLSLQALKGDEFFQAAASQSRVSHRAWSRYRDDMRAGMRLRIGDRVLEIVAALDRDDRRQFLELMCEEWT